MKRLFYLVMAALMALTLSCKKDNPKNDGLGVDGKTPLPQVVDMGTAIDGRVFKWASCNLGASTTAGYGDYYCWGELEPKSEYTETNYSYDEKPAELPLSLDPARKKLGGKWRMPTKAEFEVLLNVCQTEEKEVADGVKGILFISRRTGNTLFLPLSSSMNGTSRDLGTLTSYLSTTVMEHSEYNAWGLSIYPKNAGFSYLAIIQGASRARGNPIRPVYEE